jgi:hypothetical protein
MNVTKSLSSPNILQDKNQHEKNKVNVELHSQSDKVDSHHQHHTNGSSTTGKARTSFEKEKGGRKSEDSNNQSMKFHTGKMMEKLISPFHFNKQGVTGGSGGSFSTTASSSTSKTTASGEKEIEGSLTVAFIDQKALVDCENLFNDCEAFLTTAKEVVEISKSSHETSIGASTSSSQRLKSMLNAAKFTKWRTKRKGNKLSQDYEQLIGKSENCEKNLKIFTDKLLNDSSSLMLQALHLKSRLTACMTYNKEEVAKMKPKMDGTKEYLKEVMVEKHQLLDMLTFFDEIIYAKGLQQKHDAYIPWAVRNTEGVNHPLILSAAMLNRDEIQGRIKKVEKVRKTSSYLL